MLLQVLVNLKQAPPRIGHTHEQAFLAYTLSVKQLIVGVNQVGLTALLTGRKDMRKWFKKSAST